MQLRRNRFWFSCYLSRKKKLKKKAKNRIIITRIIWFKKKLELEWNKKDEMICYVFLVVTILLLLLNKYLEGCESSNSSGR